MTAKSAVIKNIFVDPDDAPELTDAWFEKADLMHGDKRIRRGRPAGHTKASQTIRLDLDILAAFKSTGKGWQTRMNDALREWIKEHPIKPACPHRRQLPHLKCAVWHCSLGTDIRKCAYKKGVSLSLPEWP